MKSVEQQPQIYPECYWCAENVGRIAVWGNIGLFSLKLFCGITGGSRAVVADAVHSGVDIVTAAIVMISLRVSKAPPDKEHPYGHGQVEYVSSMFIGMSLTLLVGAIIYNSIVVIIQGVTVQPSVIALLALIVSMVANELMYRQSYCAGTRFRSPAMIANGLENRADVYSSFGALVGVVGAQLGFLFMDPLGAILVAIIIARSAFEMLKAGWQGVLGRSLGESVENRIRNEVNADPDVKGVVSLKTRAIGPYLAIDLKLGVSPDLTLREGYEIADRVRDSLIKKIDRVQLISVSPTGFYYRGGIHEAQYK
ncbi:MAG: cation transporter [Deltaproteobacteria bacterium]|nr:cation transporter [Deltaproteobacteria bacterium]